MDMSMSELLELSTTESEMGKMSLPLRGDPRAYAGDFSSNFMEYVCTYKPYPSKVMPQSPTSK